MNWTISDIADIANIITGLFSAGFAFYIFLYQWRKDEADKKESERLHEETTRLQWFKELIIQPHLADIKLFYSELYSIEKKLSEKQNLNLIRWEICDFLKDEEIKFRKSFIDSLAAVDITLYNAVKENTGLLIDTISFKIDNSKLKLHRKETFEKEIGSLIMRSRNDLINKIYNFRGHTV